MVHRHLAQLPSRARAGNDAPAKEATLVERADSAPLPTGTLTFALSDVEGSVRLWESQHDAMAAASATLDTVVSRLVAAHRGVRPVEQGEGDSFVAAFTVARDAVDFVVALQHTLLTAEWAKALPLRARMALHTGAAEVREGDHGDHYMGPTINRCARLRALAHGGQVLLSGATAELAADDLGDVSLLDLGIHHLRDFDRPERVFQLVHPALPDHFPPLREQALPSRALPVPLTSFVARTEELTTLAELLGRERLVTLTGAGGSGKTRLALECAHRQAGDLEDGAAWADAAPITDGSLVTACVAAAVGVREVASEPLLDTVVREVGERDVLLVIDNCEHVVDDAARIVERLLVGCPRMRVLATSREPLGVAGETAMRVPSLPDPAATELFCDRARAVRPDFSRTPESEEAVAEVCRRLDGIPLAIELAAARVQVLTPQQIADGLADRFRLLTGGARTALPRQRTLEASVDWSYRLLGEEERLLLDRLSVFSGGFTLEAAQEVCADDALPASSVLDHLTALVGKSLVQVDGGFEGSESRYRMLETIRHFARQRLADSPDPGAPRDRHLAYYLSRAEELGPRIEQGEELVWLDRLDADLDNLRAALDWAQQSGASDLLLRLAGALWLFWEVRCHFDEACARLRGALSLAPEPTRERAIALYGLGDISLFTLDIAMVAEAGHEVVAIGEHLDDPLVTARGITLLGWASAFGDPGDVKAGRGALTEVLGGLREADNPWLSSDANLALGFACGNDGDLRAAEKAFADSLPVARRWRNLGGIMRSLTFRGWAHVLAGEAALAEASLIEAVELADAIGDTFWRAVALAYIAQTRLLQGDLLGAELHAREAWDLGERFVNPHAGASGACVLARTLATGGDTGQALATLDASSPVRKALRGSWLTADAEATAAIIEAGRGEYDAARARLDAAAEAVAGRAYAVGHVALARGQVERLAGDDAAAETAFTEAVRAAWDAGARLDAAEALEELGVSAARREQFERAARLFASADAERERLGVVPLRWEGCPDPAAEVAAVRDAVGDAVGDEAVVPMELDEAVRFALRGKGGRRRPTSGWESLTPTEREVVRLVAEGLSNPAIAEKLLITRGTVKVHLSHVFTRLGMSSRAELAAEATRRGFA